MNAAEKQSKPSELRKRVDKITISVLYSCHKCGLKDVKVQVPIREPNEDVKSWMDTTAILLGDDHNAKNPHCFLTELSEVKIPIPVGTEMLGGPPLH